MYVCILFFMANAPLRPKEKELLSFFTAYLDEHGFAPTYRELQDGLGYEAVGSVQTLVKQLIDKEYLLNNGRRRGLVLASDNSAEAQRIPLAGSVAAGVPIEAIETSEFIDVPRFMTPGTQNYFALKVKGDSMIDDHIADGDYVVVRKQKTAAEREIIVALVDNEATLKRFRRNKGVIELHPANSNYRPIRIHEDKKFEILGVLTGVLRKF